MPPNTYGRILSFHQTILFSFYFFFFLFSQAVPGEEPPLGPSGDDSAGAATPA